MIRLALIVALVLAAAAPARADDLHDVIARYVAWRGGAAYLGLRSTHQAGQMRQGPSLSGTFESWTAGDGRSRLAAKLGPYTSAEAVTLDGGWAQSMSGQIEDLGENGDSQRRSTLLDYPAGVEPSAGETLTLMAPERREGRLWAVVRAIFSGPDTYDLFIDPSTGELLGVRASEDGQTSFARYGDWRMVSGVRMPFVEEDRGANMDDTDYRVTATELNVDLPASLFARPGAQQVWRFVHGGRSTDWISFDLFQGHIYLMGAVNGRSVLLVLDSGAGITVVDPQVAKAAGIRTEGGGTGIGIGGQIQMQLAPNVEVKVGDLTLAPLTVAVTGLHMVDAPGHQMGLLLGREALQDLVVDIDFRNHRLAFRDPEGFNGPPGARRVPLGRHDDNRTIPLSIEGRPARPFDFDLGDDGPLSIYPAYRDETGLLQGRPQIASYDGGLGGVKATTLSSVKTVALAGVTLSNVPATYSDVSDPAAISNRAAGRVGLPVFQRFHLVIDYPHDALWLTPDADALAKPFAKNRTGLTMALVGDRLKVTAVEPGSPADREGFKRGLEILKVNGRTIDAGDLITAEGGWTSGPAGSMVELTLVDGSIRRLTLTDYY